MEHWGMVARWRATNIYRGDGAMSDQEGMMWWRRKPRKGKVKVVFISITTTFSGRGCGAFKAGNCDGRGLGIKFEQVIMAKEEEEGKGIGKRDVAY